MLVRTIYTLLLAFVAPILLFGLYKSRPNKPSFGSRWKEHFGVTPKLKSEKKPIWIHAVSVGESIAAIPLIKELKKQNPEQPIVVTTTTSTGAEQIMKNLKGVVEHRYMPIDFTWAVTKFINTIQPTQLLIIETELWPNTLKTVSKFGVPITLVNARLSEKSCRNYLKVKPLFNLMQSCLNKVLCQTHQDAENFKKLGIPNSKLFVTGSIKFDITVQDDVILKGKELRSNLGQERSVWVAASTHPGEEEQVLKAHRLLLEKESHSLLIIVPRHPERFESVFKLCQNFDFETVRRTALKPITDSTQVYLADTMGELLLLLAASDVCFMGGSLAGDKVGGHNVLEPAVVGVPIITGNSYFNFKEIIEAMKERELITIVENYQELSDLVGQRESLSSPQALVDFIHEKSGAIRKITSLIQL